KWPVSLVCSFGRLALDWPRSRRYGPHAFWAACPTCTSESVGSRGHGRTGVRAAWNQVFAGRGATMGRKPVQVLAGVALVGLLAAGCERNSTVGGVEGSARVSQGPAGFNGRGTVATRTGSASIAAAGQTATPMGSAAG